MVTVRAYIWKRQVTASSRPVAARVQGRASAWPNPFLDSAQATGVRHRAVTAKALKIQKVGDECRSPILSMLAEMDHKKATASM